jgi:hypothetical protein
MPKVGRFFEEVTFLFMYTNAEKIQGRSIRKDGQMTCELIFKQNHIPGWLKISNIV